MNHCPPPSLLPGIKQELGAFVAAAGTKRSLPVTCHVGHPRGEQSRWQHHEIDDQSLRADLVERAIDGLLVTRHACAWVTRGGGTELTDPDADWFAAARTGFARHGLELPAFFVLNRRGWVDLVSGVERQWYRVRGRASVALRSDPGEHGVDGS